MLSARTRDKARRIAALAKSARGQRDALLGNVAEAALSGIEPGRGEHNPTAELGYDPLPTQSEDLARLRAAVAKLTPTARVALYTLMRIGQGDLAAGTWDRGASEAKALGDATIAAALLEDADLHDHIEKGLHLTEGLRGSP
jgi:hypothetical protein